MSDKAYDPAQDRDRNVVLYGNADTNALWARPKADITEEQYQEFYKHVGHDFDDPLAWSHARVEGRQEYTHLLYIPSRAPFDLWDRNARHGIKLYVRRVFIMDDAGELLPRYLRFVRGVIDSGDLPLNVSREILQESKDIEAIRAGCTKKVLGLLDGLEVYQLGTEVTLPDTDADWITDTLEVAGFTAGLAQEGRGRLELASQHEHETDCQVGYCVGIAGGSVGDRNAGRSAGLDVDVDRVAAADDDHAQVGQFEQGFGIHDVHFGDKNLAVFEGLHQVVAGLGLRDVHTVGLKAAGLQIGGEVPAPAAQVQDGLRSQ